MLLWQLFRGSILQMHFSHGFVMIDSTDASLVLPVETLRCTLRPATSADLPHIERGIGNPLFPALLPLSEMYRNGQLQSWLERMCLIGARGRNCFWSIDLKSGETCVGQVGLMEQIDSGVWLLSFWLAPPYWKRSLARESVASLLEHAFSKLGIAKVSAATAVWNLPGRSLLLSLGFRITGESEAEYEVDGKPQAVIVFSLTKAD
jgi:ribosomal-protein-alanine N-acetyltransferase